MFFFARKTLVRTLIKPRFSAIKTRNYSAQPDNSSRVNISQRDRELYNKNGVVCLRSVFSQEWITKVSRGIRQARNNPGKMARFIASQDGDQFVYFLDYNNCRRISEFEDYVFNSPAAELAGKLMSSKKSIFYYDNIFVKDPKTCRATPWHQDQTYYPLEGSQTCSIWMPVTPVFKESCIKFIKGSHEWGYWYWPKQFSDSKDYQNTNAALSKKYKEIPNDMETNADGKYDMLTWDVNPGDCIVFNLMCVHGFPTSVDHEGREVLSTRWVGEKVTFGTRPWDVDETLMKGGSKLGDYVHENEKDYPTIWQN